MNFLAIDFETANYKRESACAIGLVRVENGIIVQRQTRLIKPPNSWFVFTSLHGIAWNDVKDELTFGELWPEIRPMFNGVDFLCAHNSSFDEGVLKAYCRLYDIRYPEIPFRCTVKISRSLWNIYPTKLNNVCDYFGIPLNHHEAGSDTEACARIMIRALEHTRARGNSLTDG
ncbi:MAG: 3'-5' exonuclease [Ignavibacteria bacterium]|nr:3'-5' exonuclease [Ignavibacteria bacterium]MCU7505137.1 3'-5' exonuclease [Ignavibacteria bacterium]MCU7518011.1 3'-5' exonuclease [Ignavibacteria bacterium]